MLSTQTKVEASLNEAGDLIVVRDGKKIATIERSSISDESRNALTAFVKVCGELTSIEEWDGKPVIADRPVALHDQHGLPFTVLRGQALDEYELIAQCLRIEGPQRPRLLRQGAELEVETMLREQILTVGQEGLAKSTLLMKRALQAHGA